MPSISRQQVQEQLELLGVPKGGVLLAHCAFSKVKPIVGGPLGLIKALRNSIGPDGTLVMPTMSDGRAVFDPQRTPSLDMGIVAETFWRQAGVLRSCHPGASFAALGPQATTICKPHPLSPPHGLDSPVGQVYQLGGHILLLGVGHSENTSMHLAEALAPVPYSVKHPCVVDTPEGSRTIQVAETDHCCLGFNQMDEILDRRGLQSEAKVGQAGAKLVPAQQSVDLAVELLRIDATRFLCSLPTTCEECNRAWRSIDKPE